MEKKTYAAPQEAVDQLGYLEGQCIVLNAQ